VAELEHKPEKFAVFGKKLIRIIYSNNYITTMGAKSSHNMASFQNSEFYQTSPATMSPSELVVKEAFSPPCQNYTVMDVMPPLEPIQEDDDDQMPPLEPIQDDDHISPLESIQDDDHMSPLESIYNRYIHYSNQNIESISSPVVFTNDTIVNTVIESFISRSNLGFKKYNNTLDREDLSTVDWVNHTQEELMDAILYLERLKKNLQK